MLDKFSWRHIPALLAATPMLFGGRVHGLSRPHQALLTWGMTEQTASSHEAQIVYYGHTMRTSTLGLLIYVFYLQGNFAAVDAVMAVVGAYTGIVDVLVIYRHGDRGVVPWRLASVVAIAACGFAGTTASSTA